METIHHPDRRIKPVLFTAIYLIIIQAVRSGIIFGSAQATGTAPTALDITSTGSFIILGAVLWFVFKANRVKLDLDLSRAPKWGKTVCLVLLILVTAAMISGLIIAGFAEDAIFNTLHSIIVIPIFEELIFRGYIWNYLKSHLKKEWAVYLTTTVMFALWHLGYAADVYLRTGGAGMANIMLMKVLIGAVFGAMAGFLRWKTRNTYSAILIHALMNVFGR